MRIALVAPEYPGCGPNFGVGRYISTLASGLSGLGHQVVVLAVTSVGNFTCTHEDPPRLEKAANGPAALRPLLEHRWLVDRLRRFAPDVVEYCNWGGLGFNDLGDWLRAVRLVTPSMSIRPEDPLRRATRYLHHAWEHLTVRHADLVIADSRAMAVLGRRCYGRSAGCIVPLAWKGDLLPIVRSGHDVLYVGRLEHRKGIDILLCAWAAVRRRMPSARLHLVGSDRQGYGQAQLERWGRNGVEVHGRLDDATLATLRSTCRIQVVTSRFESFGLVALEGWGGGQAVIASRCGGLAEIIDGVGAAVPPGEPAPLAQALCDILANIDLSYELAERGRQRLVERYLPERCASATIAAYRSHAGTHGIGGGRSFSPSASRASRASRKP